MSSKAVRPSSQRQVVDGHRRSAPCISALMHNHSKYFLMICDHWLKLSSILLFAWPAQPFQKLRHRGCTLPSCLDTLSESTPISFSEILNRAGPIPISKLNPLTTRSVAYLSACSYHTLGHSMKSIYEETNLLPAGANL